MLKQTSVNQSDTTQNSEISIDTVNLQSSTAFHRDYTDCSEPQRSINLKFLEEQAKNEKVKNVLDIACADGTTTAELKKLYPNSIIEGIDLSAALILKANAKYEGDPNLKFHQENAVNLIERAKTESEKYDIITCFFALHWIGLKPEPRSQPTVQANFLLALNTLLKPQGRLFMITPLENKDMLEARQFVVDQLKNDDKFKDIFKDYTARGIQLKADYYRTLYKDKFQADTLEQIQGNYISKDKFKLFFKGTTPEIRLINETALSEKKKEELINIFVDKVADKMEKIFTENNPKAANIEKNFFYIDAVKFAGTANQNALSLNESSNNIGASKSPLSVAQNRLSLFGKSGSPHEKQPLLGSSSNFNSGVEIDKGEDTSNKWCCNIM